MGKNPPDNTGYMGSIPDLGRFHMPWSNSACEQQLLNLCVPILLKPSCLKHMLHNKRSHNNENPVHGDRELPPLAATRESPGKAMKTQCIKK